MNSTKQNILVVDNDKHICWVLKNALSDEGYTVDIAMDGESALGMIDSRRYALVIMDVRMPVMDGITALSRIHELPDRPETIIVTAHSNMENTVEAMKLGAFDYIVKPFDIDTVIELAGRAIERYENRRITSKASVTAVSETIIGDSTPMRELYKLLGRVASTNSSVLITGETGTGKDLFARAIHFHSERREKPFITVNCASIPGELLESELFGHESGAFTGASSLRKGKCELADGGTLFLDEISTMRLDLQAKLLTFLQRSEFERIGSSHTIHVDIRVIAASNADLKGLVKGGMFREDLYYRLMVVPMHIPALRDRKEDIPKLVKYFVNRFNTQYALNYTLKNELLDSLAECEWPGNVRELENLIHRMVVLQSERIEHDSVQQFDVPGLPEAESIESAVSNLVNSGSGNLLTAAHERIEKPLLEKVMAKAGSNQSEASKILGISRNTLRKMLTKYGMST
ncbi:sigma-54-dependent transcriptional regulator [Candidatus Omnitrophota bacterium]